LLCVTAGANAAVEVIGNGPARDCYHAARQAYGTKAGEDICNMALTETILSLHDRAATLVNRGVIRTRDNRMEAALLDDEQAIAMGVLKPSDLGIAYVNRASVLNGLGRPREALESAEKGLSLGAGNAEIGYYARAVAKEMLGDVNGAYHDYKQAISLRPDFVPAARQLTRFKVETR
jgi:tetratricopeptide (TPR) repeat protein